MSRAGVVRPPTRTPRIAVLDGLRLIAALAVVGFHYTVAWRVDGVRPPQHFLPTAAHVTVYGFLGVELFFMISGFVICMSSWGRKLGDFFTSRVSRLYPAYWVCILLTLVVVTILPISGGVPQPAEFSLTDIAVNLTMLQEPMGVPSVDTVYWTLFVELRFYLLFAFLVRFGLDYRRTVLFCAVWMTVALIAPTLQSPLITMLTIPEYAPYFIAGIAMYLIHRFGPTPLLYAIVGFAWLICLDRVSDRVGSITPGFGVPRWPGLLFITVAYLVMLAVALRWTDRITWSWLTVAGALTYPFYLLHQRIGYSVMRTVYEHTKMPVWMVIAATAVGVAGLAWLVHRVVERPLTVALRSALRRSIAELRPAEPVPAPVPAPGPALVSVSAPAAAGSVVPARSGRPDPVNQHPLTPRQGSRPERSLTRPPTR